MSDRFYLGIDGGQSSTTALIADANGRVLGRGAGGPCNHVAAEHGRAKFFANVGASFDQACHQAHVNAATTEFAAACLGFSGGASDKEDYSRELIHSARFKITHDAYIALAGATEGKPGIIVIAGTGSIAFGRNAVGETARAGGWGYVFGDEGGGFDLTRRALQAILRFEEGWGAPTTLYASLLEKTTSKTANDLLHSFYAGDITRPQMAALSSLVTLAAEEGDETAQNLVRSSAEVLAVFAEAVYRQLFAARETVPIAAIGGVFRSNILRRRFSAEVEKTLTCPVIAPRQSPAAGALIEALRLDGNQSPLSDVPESDK